MRFYFLKEQNTLFSPDFFTLFNDKFDWLCFTRRKSRSFHFPIDGIGEKMFIKNENWLHFHHLADWPAFDLLSPLLFLSLPASCPTTSYFAFSLIVWNPEHVIIMCHTRFTRARANITTPPWPNSFQQSRARRTRFLRSFFHLSTCRPIPAFLFFPSLC